ncbi:MAG: thiamine pyrophosphate-dependent dehydrogenase E1 component subunit alpha [Chloroflexota bacterium]
MIQVLNHEGQLVGEPPDLNDDELHSMYRWMVYGRLFSDRMVALQRQGRIGTNAPLNGQEASAALATALGKDDWFLGSYREIIPMLIKGMDPLAILEVYKGNLPLRYKRENHVLPMQIVLAAQMPHAAGVAMAIKYEQKPNVVVGVCGDGATSEGDFNETLNFAGVYKAPLIVVVQNNGWAISVPRHVQTAARYIADRGAGFGVPSFVVDGNDALAVHKVMADCVARARAGEGPSLVEMITYRLGAHTTADDPTKYRPQEELDYWRPRDPLLRMRAHLLNKGILTNTSDEQLHEACAEEIQTAVSALETLPPSDPARLFDLVYETPTPQLERQRDLYTGHGR